MDQKLAKVQHHLTHPKYRPDIDGLRAIAVLSVVGFHAFPNIIGGGFIGVDIFFVISGYLISTIMFDSLERNSFSFFEFYIRRIRRIFPALILVLIASFVFGWFVLFAGEYKMLGKHIAGGAGFLSNILLWLDSGYFDSAADTKPLLHLWSLGVEEQFYIVWPFLLVFAWKRRWGFIATTVTISVISLVFNIYLTKKDPVAAFYLLTSRFWELMIGGGLAYVGLHKPQLNNGHKDFQSFFGLFLIAGGLALINKTSAFPGWWALLPTLGALFMISAGQAAWLNRHVLSNKLLVWFGLISYPLYLWHWPLLSFARIIFGKVPSSEIRIGTVLISILLSWLTCKLIEEPMRFGKNGKTKAIALGVLMTIVGLAGYSGFRSDGFEFVRGTENSSDIDYSAEKKLFFQKNQFFACPESIFNKSQLGEFCSVSSSAPATFAIIGDSFADDKFYGLASIDKKHSWLLAGKVGGVHRYMELR